MAGNSRNILGLNRTMTKASTDENIYQEDAISWEFARNAISSSEKGDRYILSTEPSNYECCKVFIDGVQAHIVGMIYLYDDKWAVFSTLQDEPNMGLRSEIGIFDKSQCCYIPVVRSLCLNLSLMFPVRGVSRLGYRQNFLVYFGDRYNPDRVIDLGNYNLWYKCTEDRGDVDTVPWLNDIENIPYITQDGTAGTDDCYVATPVLPLEIDCNRLSLTPKIPIPCINAKKGRTDGSLPDGLYSVAICYSDGNNTYGNWFTSQLAHLSGDNNNSLDISIDYGVNNSSFPNTFPFKYIKLAIISHINGQVESYIVGTYSVMSSNITISFIDKGAAEPISLTEINTRKILYERSDVIQKAGKHLVRIGPYSKFDFNYQPLANLIEARWFVAEYDEKYYYDLKNSSISAYVESDVVQYMRDEVYTFYIRWVYDDGNYSSFYHIPGPPFNKVVCDDSTGEQKNNSTYIGNISGVGPDGGILLSEGYVGSFYSSEKYDNYNYKRWNWSEFKKRLKPSQLVNISLPYGVSDESLFDLCGKNIRLIRMPDESIHPSLHLYNVANRKVRYLGVKFGNIYHPLDDEGNRIEGIIGFEIWRAIRGANRTIIAKGVIAEGRGYNYIKEKDSNNNPNGHNAIFESYPVEDNTNQYNPFISLSKTNIKTSVSNANNILSISMDIADRDLWDSYTPIRYKNISNARKDFIFFHSPETTYGYPYLNGNYIKQYGEVYNESVETSIFVNNTNYPKAKLLSPSEYSMLIQRSILSAYRVLNGSVRITYGGHDGSSSRAYSGVADLASGSTLSIINIILKTIAQLTAYQIGNSLLPSFPLVVAGFNSMGFGLSEVVEFIQSGIDGLYLASSILGGSNYKSVSFERSNDGLLDTIPKSVKKRFIIPLYFFALNEVYYENKTIQETSKPFIDYTVTKATKAELHKFMTYINSNQCLLNRIKDAIYLMPYTYTFEGHNINHRYRTQCVLMNVSSNTPLGNKIKPDNTLNTRIYNKCCDITTTNSTPDEVTRCKIYNPASLRYVSYKVSNTRPYSQIYGNAKVKIGCITRIPIPEKPLDIKAITKYSSILYYGGDTYVTRHTEIDRFMYFTDYPIRLPDGFEFNYLAYRNVLFPRFWINTQKQSLYETYMSLFNSVLSSGNSVATSLFCSDTGNDCKTTVSNYIEIMSTLGYDLSSCKNSLINLCKVFEIIQSMINGMNSYFSAISGLVSGGLSVGMGAVKAVCESIPGCNGIISCIVSIVLGIICVALFIVVIVLIMVFMIVLVSVAFVAELIIMINMVIAFAASIAFIVDAVSCLTNASIKDSPLIVNSVVNYNLDGCTGAYCSSNKYRRYFIADSFNDLWMYLADGVVRDFFVESSYNMAFRITRHPSLNYSTYDPYNNTSLYDLFSVDVLKNSDFFIYNNSLNIQSFEMLFATVEDIQPIDYNEVDADKAYIHDRRMVIYSLPHIEDKSKIDSWRIYLPLNFRYFNDIVTGIQDVNGNGAIVFFRFKPPQFYAGTEILKMNTGREVIIGTGGLFRQEENTSSNADPEYQYGSMQSVTAVANTPFGIYFISNNTRKIFGYSGNLVPISDNGLKMWANWYCKFYIKEEVENLDDFDNTLLGIGDLVTCDNKYGLVYFIKRDYRIVRDFRNLINTYNFRYYDFYVDPLGVSHTYCVVLFDKATNNFFNAVKVYDFFNPQNGYVEDISWTLSYDPYIQSFVSYHDWKPDLAEGSNDTFITVKKKAIWVHNKNCSSYCNFYGEGYNFEVDIRDINKDLSVTTNRSIEYYLECYKYDDDCKTKFHKLDYNFDNLIIYNTEQCSGMLNLVTKKKNDPFDSLSYPAVNFNSIDVLCEKVEQKYRVNMYYDIVKDRGEYSGAENPIFEYSFNGIDRILLNNNLDYNKSVIEHKRFRHYIINKYFIKKKEAATNDIPYKMMLYLFVDKNALSLR